MNEEIEKLQADIDSITSELEDTTNRSWMGDTMRGTLIAQRRELQAELKALKLTLTSPQPPSANPLAMHKGELPKENLIIFQSKINTVMEFEVFDMDNVPVVRIGEPIVSFDRKSGLVTFRKGAIEKMKLKDGDRVKITLLGGDTYVYKTQKTNGFVARHQKKDSTSLNFNATALVSIVLKRNNAEKEGKKRFLVAGNQKQTIAEEEVELWFLK